MRTMIEDVHSDENNILGPPTNPEPFRLGLPLRPTSPTHSATRPPDQPVVVSPQQERTTSEATVSPENPDIRSSRRPSPVPQHPPSEDADDTDPPADTDDELEDIPLPRPLRLQNNFRRPKAPAQEPVNWKRHEFRLVEMNRRRYYDVRGDAVSSSGNA
jgi:hypothetical protein